MNILFDQGTPVPLHHGFAGHQISTAYELGWAVLKNGELLAKAEGEFDLFVTTDQSLRYQQNLTGKRLAIFVLPTTSWPELQQHSTRIVAEATAMRPGEFRQFDFSTD